MYVFLMTLITQQRQHTARGGSMRAVVMCATRLCCALIMCSRSARAAAFSLPVARVCVMNARASENATSDGTSRVQLRVTQIANASS
jgi:type IV secretory pathway TrbD component